MLLKGQCHEIFDPHFLAKKCICSPYEQAEMFCITFLSFLRCLRKTWDCVIAVFMFLLITMLTQCQYNFINNMEIGDTDSKLVSLFWQKKTTDKSNNYLNWYCLKIDCPHGHWLRWHGVSVFLDYAVMCWCSCWQRSHNVGFVLACASTILACS